MFKVDPNIVEECRVELIMAIDRGASIKAITYLYARLMYERCGRNLVRTARMTGVDRRTLHRWFRERTSQAA